MEHTDCDNLRQSSPGQRSSAVLVRSWVLLLALAWSGAAMAAVTYQAAGTAVSGTGAVSPAWPAQAINDIALLFVESTGGQPVTLSTPAGFVAVANSPQATGAGTNGTQITVFWARATSTTMATPTVADPGDHVYAQIITYRGAVTTGNPWDVTGGGVKAAASTSVTVTGVTTTVTNTLIVQAVARDDDANGAEFSAETNANLTGITERSDAGTTAGNGGGFAVWDGGKATAGATGNTTATVTSSINAFLTIALKPQPPVVSSINLASTNPAYAGDSVSWTVVFSTSVTGVDTTDFTLVPGGGVSGASITSVTGSGTTWTVTAGSGTSAGTLGLNLVDDDTIIDASGIPLGGAGAGNGNFTGQVYTISPPFCSPPSNVPSGVTVTCVCDRFGRANLNPSTIYGGNWNLSYGATDSAQTVPYINAATGLLRLTENTNNNAKAATVPSIFPAAGNYISVEFNHYAYQGGTTGADGIAVTLSDYTVPAVPGGFGGSLGYAQRTDSTPNPPGFAGGWVGIALDEYGNYQNPTEGRVLGPGFINQSVGVRGPGSGINGYRWMGGSASSPGGSNISADSTSATPAPGYMYQVIVDARNAASGTINVAVNRDVTTKNGSNYTSVFGPFNAYTEASYALSQGWTTQLVPNYWKISFTGSTGGSTNVHEIGGLRICAQSVLPPSAGAASGFSAIDEAYTGSPVPAYSNFQTGDIYMKLAGTSFKLWVGALTGIGMNTAYSSSAAQYVQVKLVDNTDNACGPDSARTCNSTCTNKTAVEAGATQIATFVSGSTTGVGSQPTFTLNSSYKDLIAVMKECTTSSCAAFTATAPACSADSFSVRPASVASVVSSNATNTGTGGTPIFKAGSGNFSLTATTTGVAGSPSNYTGVLKINSTLVAAASPATVNGTLTGSFPAATSGTPSSTATGTTFTYSEVGGFTLPVNSVYDGVVAAVDCASMTTLQCDTIKASTWTGLDSISTKGDCDTDSFSNTKDAGGKYGCNFGNSAAAGPFGRFVPDHFDTAVTQVSGVPMPCPTGLTCPALFNGFVYSGQAFTTQIAARNASGALTFNYDSAKTLSKATTLTAWDALGSTTTQNPGGGTLNPNAVPSTAFNLGMATMSTPVYTFPVMLVAPTDIYIRATDTDYVTSSRGVSSVEGGIKVVSGRFALSNAFGSQLLPLPMTATVQYWNGTNWPASTTDNVTSFNTASNIVANIVKGPLAGVSVVSPGVVTVTGGTKTFTLNAPLVTGSADISLSAPAYLLAGSNVAGVNPSKAGRATFGEYKGVNQFIYYRENY